MTQKEYNYFDIAESYLKLQEDYIYNLRYRDEKLPDYPHDIIHDISYILSEKPLQAFFFCKDYISTGTIEIKKDIIWSFTDDKSAKEEMLLQNLAYIRNVDYYITNIENKGFDKSYYEYCLHLYHGKFHDYDLKNKSNADTVVNLLKFFIRLYLKKLTPYFKPEEFNNPEYTRLLSEYKL